MGLRDFFPFLSEIGVLGQRQSNEETLQLDVELDLFGCYYNLIKYWLAETDVKELEKELQLKQEQQQQQQQHLVQLYFDPSDTLKLTDVPPLTSTHHPVVCALHSTLCKSFSQNRTRIHAGDIYSTLQKCVGQEDRAKQRHIQLEKLHREVAALPQQRGRARGRALKKLRKQLTVCRPIQHSDVKCIINGLRQLHWTVCECPGESDVCAARHVSGPNSVPVSVDSDLFMHSTSGCVLKKATKGGFFLYRMEDVRRKLDMSEIQYLILGLVAKSDYSVNVPHRGLTRNRQSLQLLKPSRFPEGHVRHCTVLHRLLDQAQTLVANEVPSFKTLENLQQAIIVALYHMDEIHSNVMVMVSSDDTNCTLDLGLISNMHQRLASVANKISDLAGSFSNDSPSQDSPPASLPQEPFSNSPSPMDTELATSDTLKLIELELSPLVDDAKSLLDDVTCSLRRLLQDYKDTVGSQEDNSASWDVYIEQHEDRAPQSEQDQRREGLERGLESYKKDLNSFVAACAILDSTTYEQETAALTRPFPRKMYAAHTVHLAESSSTASSSEPPPPPPFPPPPPPDGETKVEQQQGRQIKQKKLTKKQLLAQQERERKKEEKARKKQLEKEEKAKKKLEAKKEREKQRKKEREAKRKAKPLKRSSKRMKYNKSGKGARYAKLGGIFDRPASVPKKKRTLTTTTRVKMSLKRAHGVVSMETGTIHGLLEKNVAPLRNVQCQRHSLEPLTDTDLMEVTRSIDETLQRVVSYLNNSRRWIHVTLELLIANEVKAKKEAASNRESFTLLALLHQTKCQNIISNIGTNLRKSWDDLVAEEEVARAEQEQQGVGAEGGSAADFDHRSVARTAVMDLYRCLEFSGGDTALRSPPCTVHDAYNQMVNEIASEFGQFYTKLEFELMCKVNDFLKRDGKEERETHSDEKDKISLWFRRNLMLPPGERWKFYPYMAFSDGYITITELALRQILWSRDGETTRSMKKVFGMRDDVQDLSFSLFVDRTNHSRRTMPLQEYIRLKEKPEEELTDGQKRLLEKKFQVASGTIMTNGRVVKALAYNTKRAATKDDGNSNIEETIQTPSPNLKQESAPKRKSILDQIPYLHDWRQNEENMQRYFPGGTSDVRVVGIDPGIVVPCAAAALHAPTRHVRVSNAIVTQKSMSESKNRLSSSLRSSKSKPISSDELGGEQADAVRKAIGAAIMLPSIQDYEASMPSHQSPDPGGVEDYARWFSAHHLQLYHFYQSPAYVRKQWANNRGLRAEYEQILNVVLMTVGLQPHNLQEHNMTNVMVVVGDGHFDAARGGSSFHTKVIEFLFYKLTALGIPVTKVDEYKTSSVCPRCDQELVKEMRRVTCTTCQVQMHRDSAGAHNIARVGMDEFLHNARPASLRRPPRSTQPFTAPEAGPMAPPEDLDVDLGQIQAA
ncbi:hypothetical protein EC968_007875 [Mortierella alpina]|nr:hypothetical protein EC968_007875 [Mortierella alpina]